MQLCIPRVDTSYSRDYIFKTLCKLKWGRIQKIYETTSRDNDKYKCVLININWNDNENQDFKERLIDGGYINIIHDKMSPYFWRILLSTRKR